ncbi:MAG: hypothetical protein MR660_00325 [Peptoniphilaceae bacterium]|nr:hypothetical protein [Peptoniphilaceae bacterium]MDY4196039.1 hypothetical protein [Peptoniphilaceae bacterium]MDY5841435.1 hypothetical protein [Peptoniphilaceae bacterium]MDY6146300.1 hypothetical protein [Peptoniphilaceae bacterium]
MKNISKTKKVIITIVVLILIGVIGSFGSKKTDNIGTEKLKQSENNITAEEAKGKKYQEKFADDEIVNDFIISYNKISASPFTDIEKGNIKTKYHALSEGYWFELLNAANTNAISVKIEQTNETAEQGVKGMKTVFRNVVKTIDDSLSDQEINDFFDTIVKGYQVENQKLGKTKVSYSPDVELSNGYSRGHITVDAD